MWIVIEQGPEGLEVYPHKSKLDAIRATLEIINSLCKHYHADLYSGTWVQVKSDNGLVLPPLNSVAEGPVTLYAREVQL